MASWTCQSCSFQGNGAWVRKCLVCDASKHNEPSALWTCTHCTLPNASNSRSCINCGRSKASNGSKSTTIKPLFRWTCSQCTYTDNAATTSSCSMCNSPRPENNSSKNKNKNEEYNKSSKKKQHATRDQCLITGLIREANVDYIVSIDIINMLLLFCLLHDNFDLEAMSMANYSDLHWQRNHHDGNKYNSEYEKISTTYTAKEVYHVFGTKHISQGVKYTWDLSYWCGRKLKKTRSIYLGIVDSVHVPEICSKHNIYNQNSDHHIDYFFDAKYRGYALCVATGDVFHKNAKYGKPYIMNKIKHKGDEIVTIELDLTGRFYGTLTFRVKRFNSKQDDTVYWQDTVAYDDILVGKQYRLAVAMDTPNADVFLLDDYHIMN